MRNCPEIETRIAAILTGSGLPIPRRTEIAEELRSHLLLNIACKRQAGLTDHQAIEAALADFGPPDVIRRCLRRQQRMIDRRLAAAELRRKIWLPLAFAVFFAVLVALPAPQPISTPMPWLAATVAFSSIFVLTAGSMYVSMVFGYRFERPQPRTEYRFLPSYLRGMAVVALGFAALVPFAMIVLAACAPVFWARANMPSPSPFLLSHNFVVAWFELAGRNFGLCALSIIGFGLGLAFYERSRCVDLPDLPETA